MKAPLIDRVRAALEDRYRVERELGQGGMATVFLADDLRGGDRVALKVLGRGMASRILRERFHREFEVGATLRHPHIVPITDGGEVEDVPFLVMPYLPEGSLRAQLDREGRLGCDEAIGIGCQVAEALAFAHEQGIIHRDIKPDNILFSGGRALVSDFGVAVAVSASMDDRLTVPGEVLGTPVYMSPEQAMGRYRLDVRTDVYSLACVLYEMLMGDPPFRSRHPDAVIVRTMTEATPHVREARPDVPDHLDAALHRALEWKPDDRFATAGDFGSAMRVGGRW